MKAHLIAFSFDEMNRLIYRIVQNATKSIYIYTKITVVCIYTQNELSLEIESNN